MGRFRDFLPVPPVCKTFFTVRSGWLSRESLFVRDRDRTTTPAAPRWTIGVNVTNAHTTKNAPQPRKPRAASAGRKRINSSTRAGCSGKLASLWFLLTDARTVTDGFSAATWRSIGWNEFCRFPGGERRRAMACTAPRALFLLNDYIAGGIPISVWIVTTLCPSVRFLCWVFCR